MSRRNPPPSQDTADLVTVSRRSWPVLRLLKTDRRITEEADLLNATAWPSGLEVRSRDPLDDDEGFVLPCPRNLVLSGPQRVRVQDALRRALPGVPVTYWMTSVSSQAGPNPRSDANDRWRVHEQVLRALERVGGRRLLRPPLALTYSALLDRMLPFRKYVEIVSHQELREGLRRRDGALVTDQHDFPVAPGTGLSLRAQKQAVKALLDHGWIARLPLPRPGGQTAFAYLPATPMTLITALVRHDNGYDVERDGEFAPALEALLDAGLVANTTWTSPPALVARPALCDPRLLGADAGDDADAEDDAGAEESADEPAPDPAD